MARRQAGANRWLVDRGSFPVTLVLLGAVLLICLAYGSGLFGSKLDAVSKVVGDFSCTLEVQRAIPTLKKAYGDSMHKVLHVGPDTCSVVSELLKEEETEAWGVEPYDVEDADRSCKRLLRKGIVRVADIKTLPDLARVSSNGVVIFTGYPSKQKAKSGESSKSGRTAKMRSSSWWIRFFMQMSLEENESTSKKFQQAATKGSYESSCQVFHLKSYR